MMLLPYLLSMLLLILFSKSKFLTTFVVVEFTAIIIDIHIIATVDVINVIVTVAAMDSFDANYMKIDTDIVISTHSTTFFLFCCYQWLLLFLFLDKSIYSQADF